MLLRAELLKLRTTRTFAVLVGFAVGLSLIVLLLSAILISAAELDEEYIREMFASDFTGLFILLLGVMGMAGEWRHRTITSAILSAPWRVRLLIAKTLAYAAAGAVVSIAITLSIMAAGTLVLELRDIETLAAADLADVLWRNVAVAAMFGAIGVCVGALVRNQAAAIVGLLLLGFVIEPAIGALVPEVGQYSPIVGAPNAIIGIDAFDSGELLSLGSGLAVMAGWIGAAFALAAVEIRRRDLT
jgi:hypothetical protein